MDIGALQFFSWPGRRVPLPEVYERALERIEIMDQSGFDCVWLAEHHFSTYSVCPSVHMMGVQAASRTNNIRIGMGVTLAAMYHPLRIAEEIALLDHFSGGRVNWGAGRGFDKKEYEVFGITPDNGGERFRENVQIVVEAWKNERLTYHGKYWDFDDVEVLPKPYQDPHPPVWMAATSRDSIEAAAKLGYSILMDPHSSHEEIGEKRELFYDTLREYGHPAEDRVLPTARLIAVADTDAEAEEIASQGAKWMLGSYISRPDEEMDPVDRYVQKVMIHGTKEKVLDEILRLREEIGLDSLICASLSHDSFVRFTNDVLPKLPR
ncbi:MAG: LLM class flavin-dependent oxidoreductase [Dehalococcoidia bacterium]|nr:LLM class flavin-dependent oxidoreductase [Dehalococcoidia bacterium]|tara:strand:+ start:150 stop:1115 length:966 start_codon:yes stop_codon:yes gene_type:complete